MHIRFVREELLKPLSYVAGVVERRQTLPILSYLLLSQENEVVELTGTDLEVEVIASRPVSSWTFAGHCPLRRCWIYARRGTRSW